MKQKKTSFRRSGNYAWVILVVVFFASVAAPFNQFKVPPIIPTLIETFQINLTQAGLFMSIIAGIGLLLAIPAGIVVQRFGSKVTILIALGLMAAGAAAGALSGNYSLLLGSRVIEGLGMGLIGVAAPATIAMWFPPDKQGTPMGIWATWVPVGLVSIYNLAPIMTASLGWQSVWWIGSGFALVMMVFSGLLITQPPAQAPPAVQTQAMPNLRQALANRNIWLLALAFACMNLTLVTLGTYYPTFLHEVRGYPLGQASFIASIATLVVFLSAPAAGWLSDKIGSRRLLFSTPFLVVSVLFIFPFHVTGWLNISRFDYPGVGRRRDPYVNICSRLGDYGETSMGRPGAGSRAGRSKCWSIDWAGSLWGTRPGTRLGGGWLSDDSLLFTRLRQRLDG